jgi:multifunctional methyltransferase subunit TRM112
MKLSTHNLLICNRKTCSDNENNFPLEIKTTKLKTSTLEFNADKTKLFFSKMDKHALNKACQFLNETKFNLEQEDLDINNDEILQFIHHILFEIEIEEGNLICQNCKREYPIKRGIVDMVLKEEEI